MKNTESAQGTADVPYADQILGMWNGAFDVEAKNRLNAAHAALLAVMVPGEFDSLVAERKKEREEVESLGGTVMGAGNDTPNVVWVLDEAEKRQVCAPEEIAYLRERFVNDNGMSLVL
jgi:hypothetical protein